MKLRKYTKQSLSTKSEFTKAVMGADLQGLKGLLFRGIESIYRIFDGMQQELEKIINADLSEELEKHLSGSKSWSPGAINDGSAASTTVTVTGASVGSPAFAGFSGLTSVNWDIYAIVTATDTVSVRIVNRTGGPVTPTGTLYVDVWTH